MDFLKKFLVALFLVLATGFFFYVFYTQVYLPLKSPQGQSAESVDIPALIEGYFHTIFK